MSKQSWEFQFHEWLAQRFPTATHDLGIGDDAAVLGGNWAGPDQLRCVLTHDTLCEGIHFRLSDATPAQIGHKALGVSLSDIAAMGARPWAALVSLVLPRDWNQQATQELMDGLGRLADTWRVQVAGGDTNRWGQGLVVGTTVVGWCRTPWLMSGARPGDVLLATGPFGGSLAGHHLDFQPRCDVAQLLAERFPIAAATDVSDSLSIDLWAICEASGCGAELWESRIPLRPSLLEEMGGDRAAAVSRGLRDGEDFELLLAVRPEVWQKMAATPELPALFPVGEFQERRALTLRDSLGQIREIVPQGYEH